MTDKKDFTHVSYTLGILSIVLGAVFQSIPGLVLGIIGLVQSKKENTPMAKAAKKLNKIGIVISLITLVFTIVMTVISLKTGFGSLANFPVA